MTITLKTNETYLNDKFMIIFATSSQSLRKKQDLDKFQIKTPHININKSNQFTFILLTKACILTL